MVIYPRLRTRFARETRVLNKRQRESFISLRMFINIFWLAYNSYPRFRTCLRPFSTENKRLLPFHKNILNGTAFLSQPFQRLQLFGYIVFLLGRKIEEKEKRKQQRTKGIVEKLKSGDSTRTNNKVEI